MLKIYPLDKINGTKNALFFSIAKLQLITALFLVCDFYIKHKDRLCAWDFPFLIPFRFY